MVQSVSTPACHAGGRRFESVRGRQTKTSSVWMAFFVSRFRQDSNNSMQQSGGLLLARARPSDTSVSALWQKRKRVRSGSPKKKPSGWMVSFLLFCKNGREPLKCNSPVDCCLRGLDRATPLFLPFGRNANESVRGRPIRNQPSGWFLFYSKIRANTKKRHPQKGWRSFMLLLPPVWAGRFQIPYRCPGCFPPGWFPDGLPPPGPRWQVQDPCLFPAPWW